LAEELPCESATGAARLCSNHNSGSFSAVLFRSKQKKVESMVDHYLERVADCVNALAMFVQADLNQTPRKKLEELASHAYAAESNADDLRKEVQMFLFGRALFPESRGDILGLLEAVDRVPNQAENVVRIILYQGMPMPAEWATLWLEQVDAVKACSLKLVDAVRSLFADFRDAIALSDQVSELESRSDEAEHSLISNIFRSDMPTADKILLRDLVEALGSIADRAEDASDRVRIIAVKRKS